MRGRKPSEIGAAVGALEELPPAPDWLPPEGKEEWLRAGAEMVERGTLLPGALATLSTYCLAVATVQRAQRDIAGREMISDRKGTRRNPAYQTLFQALTEQRRMAAELGLTPASRNKPSNQREEEDNGGGLFSDLDL